MPFRMQPSVSPCRQRRRPWLLAPSTLLAEGSGQRADDSWMFDDPLVATTPDPPSREGRLVRFGCGFVFGLVVGWCVLVRYLAFHIGLILALAVGCAVAVGAASALYGDRFWFSFGSIFRRLFSRGF